MAETTAYQRFVKAYFKDHKDATMEGAARAWRAKRDGGSGGSPRRRSSGGRDIVPTDDGCDVTVRGGAGRLSASIEGHTEVQFDSAALGALWGGLIEGLRSDGGVNLACTFPDLYPQQALMMKADRKYADNRAVGKQMGKMLAAALVAYRVTPEEWAAWFTLAAQQRFVIPQAMGVCATIGVASMPALPGGLPAEAINQAQQFGGVLGAPAGAALPGTGNSVGGGNFGQLR